MEEHLEEILWKVYKAGSLSAEREIDTDEEVVEALQAIKAKYVSRKEVEEAIGEDEDKFANVPDYAMMKPVYQIRNTLRAELRTKLLPPTKGDNE